MRTRALVVAVLAGSLTVPAVGFTEEGPEHAPVDVGTRVRLKSSSVRGQVVGEVVRADDDSLVVKRDGGTPDVRIPWTSLSKLEVSEGRLHRGSTVATGALIGGAVAFIPSGLLASLSNFQCEHRCHDVVGPTVAGTLAGAGLGALIGAAIRSDRWQEAPRSPRVSLGITPVRRGAGATVGVSF